MEYVDFFKQLFIVGFGAFAALVLTFYLIWPKIENHLMKMGSIRQNREIVKENMQLRFAAYERLLLFVHRISPGQIMLRQHQEGLSVGQFKQLLLADVDAEFQHNFTQQLYVSDAAWRIVKDLKDQTIALLRNTQAGLGDDASLDRYVETVLNHMKSLEVNPYEAAQRILKNELAV